MRRKFLIVLFTVLCVIALAAGLTACNSEIIAGKSAYELYVESYVKAYGSEEGVLSVDEWLESLRAETGSLKSIENVEIICGSVIIYYNDGTFDTLENKLPDAGHNWNNGVVTTNPTCIAPGVITYTCEDCEATKKELLDADGTHSWSEYEYDNNYHWRTCKICGEVDKHEHDFDGVSKDSNAFTLLECDCGFNKTVGEIYSYKVTFELGYGVSVIIYDNQNYSDEGYLSQVAYSRDGGSGELLNDGEGQVNFEVVVELGYKIKNILITSGYKNLKDSSETGRENTYRITKITDNLKVTIESEIDVLDLPVMVINTENSAQISDKENYVTCSVSLLNAETEYCFEGLSAGIRLRGNSTITYPKKPYRIKFEKKQGLFGWTANKSWVLLAMYQDFSNIKDYAAFTLANSIKQEDSAFVPNAKHIEVYLNGEFIGLYLLTDQVQENEGRTGVEVNFTENDTEVPFLVEWDEYAPNEGIEGVDWFKIVNEDSEVTSYYTIKYPEADQRFNQAQFEYIKNYISIVNSLCHNNEVTIEQFEEYIDLPSFIDYYLIQEVMAQQEINWKSIYMSKSINGKLVMGPVWDFDWAAGGPMSYNSEVWGGQNVSDSWFSSTNWFAYMLNNDWFKEITLNRWNEIKLSLKQSIEELIEYKDYIAEASDRNALIWDFDTDNSILDFSEYYDWVLKYLYYRLDVITELLAK